MFQIVVDVCLWLVCDFFHVRVRARARARARVCVLILFAFLSLFISNYLQNTKKRDTKLTVIVSVTSIFAINLDP